MNSQQYAANGESALGSSQSDQPGIDARRAQPRRARAAWTSRLGVGLALLLYCALLWAVAVSRPVDGDEGFYASAARTVLEGRLPYRDFFFPQAPLTAYVLAPGYLLGHSLVSARLVPCLCTVLTVVVWAWALARFFPELSARARALSVLMLALSPGFVSWGAVAKTYALSNLAMSLALVCGAAAIEKRSRGAAFGAGVLAGCVLGIRLLYAPACAAALCAMLWCAHAERKRLGPWLLLGLAGGLTPLVASWLIAPAAASFNNIGYHLIRADPQAAAMRLRHLRILITELATCAALFVPGMLAAVGLLLGPRGRPRALVAMSLVSVIALGLTSLVPYPSLTQYFTSTLPALVVPLVAFGIERCLRAARPRLVTFGLVMLTLLIGVRQFPRESGASSGAPQWRLSAVREVGRFVADNTRPDQVVLSLWSGYPIESGRRHLAGLENHFALRVAHRLEARERKLFHVGSVEDVVEHVADAAVGAVILGAWDLDFVTHISLEQRERLGRALGRHYAAPVVFPGGVQVFLRRL